MPVLRRVLPALLVLAFGGCATMSESDCRFADWRQLGRHDASQGRPARYFADRADACREYGMAADRDAYQAGWRRGLERFCTPDRGFRHGLEGRQYAGTCPPRGERAFLAGYDLGRDIHAAEQRLERLDGEIASLADEREAVEDPDSDRARRLEHEIHDRRHEIRAVERELGRLEAIAAERGFVTSHY